MNIRAATLFLVFLPLACWSQENLSGKKNSKIDKLIANENYAQAEELIEAKLARSPWNPRLNMQMGICYLYSSNHPVQALPFLEKAVIAFPLKGKTLRKGIEANYYYGQTLHRLERFLEAREVFESLRKKIPPQQNELLQKIEKEWQQSQNAIDLSLHPVRFAISNLGNNLNTPFDEHSPLIAPDESMLIFTSNRPEATDEGKKDEDIYVSEFLDGHWQPAQPISGDINTLGHDASVSLSADGKQLVIFHHNGISGDLYLCERTAKGWGEPQSMPIPINTSYNETHGCFSADGKTFVFTSDRPGGYGGKDIYMVRKLPNNEWGKIFNLGASINTVGDEESPFLQTDGKTLYFASTEHKNMGGFDIFYSVLNDSTGWSTPVNIGYPINSPNDDLFYNPSADGTRVYFASQRNPGQGGSDLHLIELETDDPRSLAVVSGFVFDAQKKPFNEISIILEDQRTGETMGLYRPNKSGKYIMIVPAGKTYKITYITANNTIEKEFSLSSRQSYQSGNMAHYIDAIYVNE